MGEVSQEVKTKQKNMCYMIKYVGWTKSESSHNKNTEWTYSIFIFSKYLAFLTNILKNIFFFFF